MRGAVTAVVAVALLRAASAAADDAALLYVDCATQRIVDLPEPGRSLRVQWSDARPGALTLQERGVDVVIADVDAVRIASIDAPPRLGFHVVDLAPLRSVAVSRLRPAGLRGDIFASARCDGETTSGAHEWLDRVRDASSRAIGPDAGARDGSFAVLERAARDAPTPALRALALHLWAQAAFRTGQSRRALDGFAAAEAAWRDAQMPAHALAARVAQVDERIRLGQYAAAIEAAVATARSGDASPYYALRLSMTRCLAQRYLGDLAGAERCYARPIAAFEAAGEQADASSALLDQADMALLRGESARAIAFAHRSLALARGPDAALLRGRARLALSGALLDTGDIQQAIGENERALSEFETAGLRRWSANALLRAAHVYAALAAAGDARDAIRLALERLSQADAPARIAAAQRALGRVALAQGQFEEASRELDAAAAIYARLAMTAEHDLVRVDQLRVATRSGDPVRVAELRQMLQPAGTDDVDRRLAIAAALIAEGDAVGASRHLAAIRARSLSQAIELARLRAAIEIAAGRHAVGRAQLENARAGLLRVVADVRNPVLRAVLSDRIVELGRDAIDSIVEEHRAGSSDAAYSPAAVAETWRWIADATLAREPSPRDAESTTAFDRSVLADVVGGSGGSASAHRDLLAALSRQRGPATRVAASMPIGAVQRSLADGERFVAHADGRRGGLLLWISRDDVRLVDAPGADALRDLARQLVATAADANGDPAMIRRVGVALGAALRVDASGSPPQRLAVHGEGVLGGLPWALAIWPGTGEPLVATTTTAIVSLSTPPAQVAMPSRRELAFLAAADGAAQLPYAAIEPQLVQAALAGSGVDVRLVRAADRDVFMQALSTPDQWIHVAAHGTSQPGRVGRSGLLLGNGVAGAAQFVSWLDVAGADGRAALVVLAACDAGSGYDTALNNLGFAAGLSRAGVDHVVAAMWPASDAAAGLWVPTFYRALAADPLQRPAEALRVAALRLRDSPHFQHPYFWAPLVAIERRGVVNARRRP